MAGKITFVLLIAALPASVSIVRADDWNTLDPSYTHASQAAYERWRDLKFGLRVHWGFYSLLGVEASWAVRNMPNEEKQRYFELYRKFNPAEFDAGEWMNLMKRCGLTYFVFTTKHHDGFSMFDTRTSVKRRVNYIADGGPKIEQCDLAYSIMDTPCKRDILKELADAAHKEGIAVGLYFSHVDWYDADFRMDKWNPFRDQNYNNQTDPAGYARFVRRHRRQIRELLTNYGKVDMLGLDMYLPDFCWPDIKQTVMMARRLQPDVLMRKRGIGAYGDYMTPEKWVPASPDTSDKRVDRPWMVIDTLAGIFAYEPNASKYKSGQWILSNLIDIVAKGGNFMVSIGPDPNGHFHPKAVAQLEYAGDWLTVNGQAIYATRPWTNYKEGEDVRFTRSKDNTHLYAICLNWPGDTFTSRLVRPRKDSKIIMLGDTDSLGNPQELKWSLDDNKGLLIEIPQRLQKQENRPCKQPYVFRIEQSSDKNE